MCLLCEIEGFGNGDLELYSLSHIKMRELHPGIQDIDIQVKWLAKRPFAAGRVTQVE